MNSDKLRFIKRAFGSYELARDNKNVSVSCPKCKNPRKKKLAIRISDDRINCWVCGLKGRLLFIIKQYRPNFIQEYVKKFCTNVRQFSDEKPTHVDVELPKDFRLLAPRVGARIGSGILDPDITRAIAYARRRGCNISELWKFRLGKSSMLDRYVRIIIPSFDANGKLNFFTGRAIDSSAYRKYWNSECEKKTIVFNEFAINWKKELTLVEGPFDLVKCGYNATCLLGSSLSEDSLLFGKIYTNRTPIVLALDSDMRMKSWQRIARLLALYDIPVRIADLGKRLDVGEMDRDEVNYAVESAEPWSRISALKMRIRSL